MNHAKKCFKYLGLLTSAILILSSTRVQSQEMNHSSMKNQSGEMQDMKAMEKMQGMNKMKEMAGMKDMKDPNAMAVMKGRMIFSMSCIFCHGSKGEGDGDASIFIGPYSHPRPNNFTWGVFKFRSTESGELPMLTDLMRTIREGIPGYMPSFRNLGEKGVKSVAMYIAKEFIREELPTKSTIKYVKHVGPYTYSLESVRRGKGIYEEMQCFSCHGSRGKGDRMDLRDERGLLIHPVDLSRHGAFGNGLTHEDIYRTIMTGLDGTPMPGYSDLFAGEEERAWDLVHYILSMQGR